MLSIYTQCLFRDGIIKNNSTCTVTTWHEEEVKILIMFLGMCMRSLENIFPAYGVQRRLRSDNFRKAAILGSDNWSHIISLRTNPSEDQ